MADTVDTEVAAMDSSNVTRRKLLKRAGVGAAALGAGSLVTAGTASAAVGCHDCHCDHCPGVNGCGTHHGTGNGACFPTTTGDCFCGEGFTFCDDLPPCDTTHDCPPGWGCVLSCCSAIYGYGTLCIPPAGTIITSDASADRPRAAQGAVAAQAPASGGSSTLVGKRFLGHN
jgi:hypothetical protein